MGLSMTISSDLPPSHFPYFGQLTGLRFIAALGVVLCHFEGVIGQVERLHFWYVLGGNGVALFFVLSGFVIAGNITSGTYSYRQYAVHRFARIVPVYWLSLLVTLLLFLIGGWQYSSVASGEIFSDELILSFFLNFFALQAWFPNTVIQQFWNAPAWSISSELFFYLCAPLFLARLGSSKAMFLYLWVLTGLLLIGYHWTAAGILGDRSIWLHAYPIRLPVFGLMAFLYGMVLYRYYRRKSYEKKDHTLAILVTITLIIFINWLISEAQGTHGWDMKAISLFYLAAIPCYTLLIYLFIYDKGIFSQFLNLPFMVLLGNASYSLYLFHWIALLVIMRHLDLPIGLAYTCIYLLTLILFSLCIYLGFEKPLKQQIIARLSK